ncbi:hypothetical protein GOP47_0004486 [Adiantum capillus-veneris]|uniref:Pentatricopeptide repeat-containing protein n=1 Tax=Adiantum capillus-veneris TaxID=13818 RepID=A0A9D4V8Y6_ADICA|nr:hypothetical protein GOP47_0004486 [Adiantum capillus-veneris]
MSSGWTALIAGHARHGQVHEALGCFHRLRSEGLSPDAVTYACALKACGIIQDVDLGKQIHDEIASQRSLEKNVVLGNALVYVYANCGVFWKPQQVLEELPNRDVISWTALIAVYAQQGQGQEALNCFHCMRSEGFFPDAVTYACILKACGIM